MHKTKIKQIANVIILVNIFSSCGENNDNETIQLKIKDSLLKSGEWSIVNIDKTNEVFWVMKNEATVIKDRKTNFVRIVSDKNLAPSANVTKKQAEKYCKLLGENYSLISNKQWIQIANQIELNPKNWTGQKIYSGCLYQGNNGVQTKGTGRTLDSSCGYKTSNNTIDFGSKRDVRSIFTLHNGSTINDFAGNLNEWVTSSELYHNCTRGLYKIKELNLCLTDKSFLYTPLNSKLDEVSGIGIILLRNNGDIFLRGGHYGLLKNTGVYSIFQTNLNAKGNATGFRCTFNPGKI